MKALDVLATFIDSLRDQGYKPEEVKAALRFFVADTEAAKLTKERDELQARLDALTAQMMPVLVTSEVAEALIRIRRTDSFISVHTFKAIHDEILKAYQTAWAARGDAK